MALVVIGICTDLRKDVIEIQKLTRDSSETDIAQMLSAPAISEHAADGALKSEAIGRLRIIDFCDVATISVCRSSREGSRDHRLPQCNNP
jgi:hypothetical protein